VANEDLSYVAWIRGLSCCVPGCTCPYEVDPHHQTGIGMAVRAHDHTCIPLCRFHHDDIHNFAGPFEGWTKEQRHAWHRAMAFGCRSAYQAWRAKRTV
jgi:hypothetical protein